MKSSTALISDGIRLPVALPMFWWRALAIVTQKATFSLLF
jgi:hypothetical protein